jgi:glycosyltransferase involved in cell wall biosynthesis
MQMKVLFNYPLPFMIAHGGAQIQIEQTQAALEKVGVEVEPLRWWDDRQRADILQNFGRMPTHHLRMAQEKGIKVVISDLLTAHGSRSRARHFLHRSFIKLARRTSPSLGMIFGWDTYRLADACLALTPLEADLMKNLFGAPAERVHVIPNGVEEAFLNSRPATRGKWLVCTATITERKRVVELAEAGVKAQTPLWIIGKPYSEAEPYAKRIRELAQQHADILRFEGPINDRAKLATIYREARGFVLLSTMESLSLSALEAAACECPLLLSDLPWARTSFKEDASYCPIADADTTAQVLRKFYDAAPNLKVPPRPMGWIDVAQKLKKIYEEILRE